MNTSPTFTKEDRRLHASNTSRHRTPAKTSYKQQTIVERIPLQSRAELITDDVGEILGHLLVVPFDLLYLEA